MRQIPTARIQLVTRRIGTVVLRLRRIHRIDAGYPLLQRRLISSNALFIAVMSVTAPTKPDQLVCRGACAKTRTVLTEPSGISKRCSKSTLLPFWVSVVKTSCTRATSSRRIRPRTTGTVGLIARSYSKIRNAHPTRQARPSRHPNQSCRWLGVCASAKICFALAERFIGVLEFMNVEWLRSSNRPTTNWIEPFTADATKTANRGIYPVLATGEKTGGKNHSGKRLRKGS